MWIDNAPTNTPELSFEIKKKQPALTDNNAHNKSPNFQTRQTSHQPTCPGCQESYFGQADRGCITSTPKSADFSKKHEKWPKYERDSCIPGPKNGERPYLAPSVPGFWDPFLARFLGILSSSRPLWTLRLPIPTTTLTHSTFLFYFYIIPTQYTTMGWATRLSFISHIHHDTDY